MLLFTFIGLGSYLHFTRSWVDADMWIYDDKNRTKSMMTGSMMTGSRTSAVSRQYSYLKSATVRILEGTGTVARIRIQHTGLRYCRPYCTGTVPLGPTRSTTGTYCASYRTERPAECASGVRHTTYELLLNNHHEY